MCTKLRLFGRDPSAVHSNRLALFGPTVWGVELEGQGWTVREAVRFGKSQIPTVDQTTSSMDFEETITRVGILTTNLYTL